MTSSRSSRSSSPASDGSRSRSPSRSRNGSPERSLATSDEDDDREVQRRIALAAPEGRIPRRDEFRNAIQEVPAPPRIPQREQRVRVALSEESRARFDKWAAGVYLSKSDRTALMQELPLVGSPLALPPIIDDALRPLVKDRERGIWFRHQDVKMMHEILLNSLNIVELIFKIGADGQGAPLNASIHGYLKLQGDLMAAGIRELIVAQRDAALRALGVSPRSAAPSFRRVPLEGTSTFHQQQQQVIPELFGPSLRRELSARDSSLKKAVDRLREERNPRPQKRISSSTVSRGQEKRERYEYLPIPHLCGSSDRIAGRLADFVDEWSKLTGDPFIINAIKGYKLPFASFPNLTRNVRVGSKTCPSLASEFMKLLEKGVIEKSDRHEFFISSTFGIPKKDGTTRPIINLKPLNKYLVIPHFKMEGIQMVSDLVVPGGYCAKVDMSDAYFSISIAKCHRKYLSFIWDNTVFEFTCMPFGLGPAPYLYTKIMRVLAEHLRSQGVKLIHYLDDWAFFGETETSLRRDVELAVQLFQRVGLRINFEKSIIQPCQSMEFLGLIIDTAQCTFAIPSRKRSRIVEDAKELLACGSPTKRQIAKLLGRLNFISVAAPGANFRLRELQRALGGAAPVTLKQRDRFDNKVELSEEAKSELRWWIQATATIPPTSFVRFSPDVAIASDASKIGWGAVCCGKTVGGRWTEKEAKEHINYLELKAAFFGLKVFAKQWSALNVLLEMDNTTAVSYIRKQGGTKSRAISELALELWEWAAERNIHIYATYKPGHSNTEADYQSRHREKERFEWSLDLDCTKALFEKFGTPEVDLFASRLNSKLEKFISFYPDPDAWKVDAFAHSWSHLYAFAFPPFILIARVIRKAVQDGAHLLLITPLWKTQSWFPLALDHAENAPMLIPKHSHLVTDLEGNPHPLLRQANFHLIAWKISPKFGEGRDTQTKQSVSLWPVGLKTLKINTTHA
ncbi:hypothetical protein Aduo_001434 [Ancylostoma duodenale]